MFNWLRALFRFRRDPADNYSPRAQKMLKYARRQADRRRHDYVGTDHLLLGLLELREGVGFRALQMLRIDLEKLRQEVEASSPEGRAKVIAPTIPLTPRARHVLKAARAEAKRMAHDYVGTEHLLLGLLQDRSGIAPLVMKGRGIELAQVRVIVTDLLGPTQAKGDKSQTT